MQTPHRSAADAGHCFSAGYGTPESTSLVCTRKKKKTKEKHNLFFSLVLQMCCISCCMSVLSVIKTKTEKQFHLFLRFYSSFAKCFGKREKKKLNLKYKAISLTVYLKNTPLFLTKTPFTPGPHSYADHTSPPSPGLNDSPAWRTSAPERTLRVIQISSTKTSFDPLIAF